MKRLLDRADAVADRYEYRLFAGLGVRPYWAGPVGWRWRLVLVYRALRGRELGGFQ